jgi:hypothetical protein
MTFKEKENFKTHKDFFVVCSARNQDSVEINLWMLDIPFESNAFWVNNEVEKKKIERLWGELTFFFLFRDGIL